MDDIIFGATNECLCKEFEKCIHAQFEMTTIGELAFFLGLQIKQSKQGIYINKAKHAKEPVKKFGLENAKAYGIPMVTTTKLGKEERSEDVDVKLYKGMIVSLLYITASRLNIMHSVCLCGRLQVCPKVPHLVVEKRILRYREHLI